MRFVLLLGALAIVVASCGDDDSLVPDGGGNGDGGGDSKTADIEPCSLLTDAELTAVLGEAPVGEEAEPAGPFTGCSWGTGDVGVSIATSDALILAPGEDECPSAGLGDESHACEQRIKILTNGIHVTVRTINPFVTNNQLVELAGMVLEKLEG